MAEGLRFVCGSCGESIEAWSDGNPYYSDAGGKKRYAYHPDHEHLALCIGNDTPHLCLACGKKFMVDSESPIRRCRQCGSQDIADTFHLAGKKCPECHRGTFSVDPGGYKIS